MYLANPGPVSRVAMRQGLIGAIATPAQSHRLDDGVAWCADNGCFGKGYPGDDAYLAWLDRQPGKDRCLFATAPDVVGDPVATLDRSLPLLPKIRALGYPAALVAQDGLEHMVVPWDAFDVLFIGGSTEWKLGAGARQLVAEAKRHGKWVHMGRVNSEKRLRHADAIGCDSADGTYLTFGPDVNLPRVLSWLRGVDHPTLWDGGDVA